MTMTKDQLISKIKTLPEDDRKKIAKILNKAMMKINQAECILISNKWLDNDLPLLSVTGKSMNDNVRLMAGLFVMVEPVSFIGKQPKTI